MMRNFFLFSILYATLAVVVLFVFRDNPVIQLYDAGTRTRDSLTAFVKYLPFVAAALLALFFITRQLGGKAVLKEGLWAFAGCLIFSAAFTFLKTSIPSIVPFYADPWFTNLDKALHGGADPWVWTHQFANWISPNAVATLYFIIWGFPAAFFPFFLAISDNDTARKTRFLILYCFVWIGLGNVIATLGSSVGPVYYDRLLGTERFTDLINALGSSGIAAGHVGTVQDGLWRVYSELGQMIGSGISAFPSVHVGVATLVMLYLCERSRWLVPAAITFLAMIQFCSVYIGWHYAVDGYFSFLAVTGVWAGLRLWSGRKTQSAPQSSAVPA
jgi:hypothetical protein